LKRRPEILGYVPQELMHSFSLVLEFPEGSELEAAIRTRQGERGLLVAGGELRYGNETASCKGGEREEISRLVLTHSYGNSRTRLTLNGKELLCAVEQLEPLAFVIQPLKGDRKGKLMLFRGALNDVEIAALEKGAFLKASLEVYAAISGQSGNRASGGGEILGSLPEVEKAVKTLELKVDQADRERIATPVFKDKEAVAMSAGELEKFCGSFHGEQCGDIEIGLAGSRLILKAFGNQAEIFPESALKFFVRHPYEITVTFSSDLKEVELNLAGQRFPARRTAGQKQR
jgi:hypothetical protein